MFQEGQGYNFRRDCFQTGNFKESILHGRGKKEYYDGQVLEGVFEIGNLEHGTHIEVNGESTAIQI